RRAGPVRDVRPAGHDRRRRAVSADTPIRVVGTAGHVDHGKSTLIRALTGIDPDRLREERERGMTIDLGFAWLTLPGGADVGTVVTGTLVDGTLSVGEEVELVPSGLRGRIRGLQTHRRAIDSARPGSRVAANLTGIDKEAIARGMVLARPGTIASTTAVGARL